MIDCALGDPPNRLHPVAWIGSALAAGHRRLCVGSPRALLAGGAVLVLGVAATAAAAAWLLERGAAHLGLAGIVLEALALSALLSIRGLLAAAREVRAALDAGDLAGARRRCAWHLVSRPTDGLDGARVASATVESVAENLTDALVAPVCFYLALGLSGAVVYRVVNTADAMLGYRDGPLEHFGKLAARLDDILNLLPARLAALAIVVAARLAGADPRAAWRTMRRDAGRTASPNAGWTMAAMAGALHVTLEKPTAYRLGNGPLPTPEDITRALRIFTLAAAVSVAATAAILTVAILARSTS